MTDCAPACCAQFTISTFLYDSLLQRRLRALGRGVSQGAFYGLCSTAPEALTASVIQLAAAQLAVCPTDTSAAPTALSRSRAPKGGTATTAQVRIPLRSLSE